MARANENRLSRLYRSKSIKWKCVKLYLVVLYFQAILSDLFPGVTIPEHDYGILQEEIESVILSKHLVVMPTQVSKLHCEYFILRYLKWKKNNVWEGLQYDGDGW